MGQPLAWHFIGHGAANTVLAAVDETLNVIARIRHKASAGTPPTDVQRLQHLIWGPEEDQDEVAKDYHFVCTYVVPSLRPHVASGVVVPVNHEMSAAMVKAQAVAASKCALLMPNMLKFPGHDTAILALEIKPKCGFIATASTIRPSHGIKHRMSRYQLHQRLKLAQGKIEVMSKYEPPDLFGGDAHAQRRALLALCVQPQNNLTVYLHGQRVASEDAPGRSLVSQLNEAHGPLFAALQKLFPGVPPSMLLDTLVDTTLAALNDSGVLASTLRLQRLDVWDIEGVHPLYRHALFHLRELKNPPSPEDIMCATPGTCPACQSLLVDDIDESDAAGGAEWAQAHQALHSLTWRGVAAVIRDYMVAITAKDCGIMIALGSPPGDHAASGPSPAVAQHAPEQQGLGSLTGCPRCGRDLQAVKDALSQAGESVGRMEGGPALPGVCDGGRGCVHACVGTLRTAAAAVRCRIGVVDFDQKPLHKIDKHLALDAAILDAWQKSVSLT